MKLYLFQHAQALSKEESSERPLSHQGINDINILGRLLATLSVNPGKILHSDKLRAIQTAEQLKQFLGEHIRLETSELIKPKSSVKEFITQLDDVSDDIAVVSHLPFVSKLASYLLCNSEEGLSINFIPGSVVCLEQNQTKKWGLTWMLRPDVLTD